VTDPLPDSSGGTAVEPDLARRAGSGMVWGQIARMLDVGLTLAIAVVVVRTLNPNAFGLYSLLTYLAGSALVFVPVVTTEALGAVLPRFRDIRDRFSLALLVGGLRIAAVLLVAAITLPLWTHIRGVIGLEAISPRVFLVAVGYWLALEVMNTIGGYYLTEFDLRPVALWKTVGQLLTLAGLGVMVLSGRDAVGPVLLVVGGGYMTTAIVLLALRLHRAGRFRRQPVERVRMIWSYTRAAWLVGVVTFALTVQIDVLLIGALTDDPGHVAQYVASVGVIGRAQVLLLSGWSSVILPALGEARMRGTAEMARVWRLFAELWLFISLPLTAIFFVIGPALVTGLFGDAYEAAGGLVVWAAAFSLVANVLGSNLALSALWALDRQSTVARVKIASTIVTIPLSLALIYYQQALGAIIATGVTAIFAAALELTLAGRSKVVEYPTRFAAKILAATAVSVGLAALVRPDSLLGVALACAVAGAVYIGICFLIRPFRREDFALLEHISPRIANSFLRRLAGA
jgi:O-antigen/teichoic acid export membrane protein